MINTDIGIVTISGTVILRILLKELDTDQHRLRAKLNTSNTGQYSTKDTAYRDMTNTDIGHSSRHQPRHSLIYQSTCS